MAPIHRGGLADEFNTDDGVGIKERLDLFEHAARVARLCVYEYHHATGLRRWSDEVQTVLGLNLGASPHTDAEFLRLVHPDDRLRLLMRVSTTRLDPAVNSATEEFRIVGGDGRIRHIQLIAHFDRGSTGSLLGSRGVLFDVTERRMAEATAASEEIRFRMAVDAADMGVYERDYQTGAGRWSDRLWAFCGLEPRAAAPSEAEFLALIHPDDLAARQRHVANFLSEPTYTISQLSHRIIRGDGDHRHLVWRSMLDRGPDGTQLIARGVVYDNTENVLAEQALRISEARFRNAVEAVGMGVFVYSPGTGRGSWSTRIWEIFGLHPRDEAPSFEDVESYVHPDDLEARRRSLTASRSGGTDAGGSFTYRIVRPGGAIRCLEHREVYERDSDGLIRIVHGVINDVTDRDAAETALRQSEARFRNAAAAANLGVFERDAVSGMSYWSDRMWEIVGRPRRTLPPSREEFLTFVHPDDRGRYVLVRDDVVLSRVRQASCEFRIVHPDGAVRHVTIHLLASPVEAVGELHIYGFIIDLTTVHGLRQQAQIAANLATLGSLAGGIAHELGQPLSAIGMSAALLETWIARDGQADRTGSVQRAVTRIQRQADRASQTIRHLLDLARGARSSGTALLTDVVNGSLELTGTTLREAGIELDISIPDGLPPVQGARLALEQVLINLLLNARDAMNRVDERKVCLEASLRDGAVFLEMEDTGGGIPDEHLPRLFEPLFTTKEKGQGTGLGLSICRNIMEANGGAISVANGVTGARFVLRFRIADQISEQT